MEFKSSSLTDTPLTAQAYNHEEFVHIGQV